MAATENRPLFPHCSAHNYVAGSALRDHKKKPILHRPSHLGYNIDDDDDVPARLQCRRTKMNIQS